MLRLQLWEYLELPEVLVNTDGVKQQTAMNESGIWNTKKERFEYELYLLLWTSNWTKVNLFINTGQGSNEISRYIIRSFKQFSC